MFKNLFVHKDYLQTLALDLAYSLVPYEDRLYTKCSSAEIVDYFFSCPFFFFFLFLSKREKSQSQFYCNRLNVTQFHGLFCSKKKR